MTLCKCTVILLCAHAVLDTLCHFHLSQFNVKKSIPEQSTQSNICVYECSITRACYPQFLQISKIRNIAINM